jgi:hypothetical protein
MYDIEGGSNNDIVRKVIEAIRDMSNHKLNEFKKAFVNDAITRGNNKRLKGTKAEVEAARVNAEAEAEAKADERDRELNSKLAEMAKSIDSIAASKGDGKALHGVRQHLFDNERASYERSCYMLAEFNKMRGNGKRGSNPRRKKSDKECHFYIAGTCNRGMSVTSRTPLSKQPLPTSLVPTHKVEELIGKGLYDPCSIFE